MMLEELQESFNGRAFLKKWFWITGSDGEQREQ